MSVHSLTRCFNKVLGRRYCVTGVEQNLYVIIFQHFKSKAFQAYLALCLQPCHKPSRAIGGLSMAFIII